jgi:hypothetical protein
MLFRGLFIAFVKNKFRVFNAAERNRRPQVARLSDFAAVRKGRAQGYRPSNAAKRNRTLMDTDSQMQPTGTGPSWIQTVKGSQKE